MTDHTALEEAARAANEKIIGTGGTMRFADGTTVDRERLVDELGDLTAAIEFVRQHALSGDEREAVLGRFARKRAQFEQWRRTEGEATDA